MNALKVDTEKKIIEAAKEVFIEKGLQGARMQEIADRAGINKALLHYYFRSKDKLFDAIFDEILQKLVPGFADMVNADMSIEERVEKFVGFYNGFFKENPFLPQFFFHEIWQNPDKLANFMKSQDVSPVSVAERIAPDLPPSESEYLVPHMISSVLGMTIFPHIGRPLFQRIFFNNNDEEYGKFLDERTNFIKGLLMGSIGANSDVAFGDEPDDDF